MDFQPHPLTPHATAVDGLSEKPVAADSAWLHELYVGTQGGKGTLPAPGLAVGLERDFGGVERWHAEFSALAKAMGGSSGWALLSWSTREARLVNHWAADHTQLLAGATPLLALDMYEHAYRMDFRGMAAGHVDAFMRTIRWEAVAQRYATAVQADAWPWSASPQDVHGDVHVIDVRRSASYAEATERVAGAVWRDPTRLAAWSREFDPVKPVLVYCVHGHDISQATALGLRARGLNARFVAGGIEACRTAGVALETKE